MTTEKTMDVDALVVGFGRGGKIAAVHLGRLGKKVVLVEQSDQMYGGTCPNVGCVPTKMLLHYSGERRPGDSRQDWYEHAVNGVRELTTASRRGNFEALNSPQNTAVITGRATFEDAHRVGVGEGEDRLHIKAETIIINTGSEPVIPPIPGLDQVEGLWTNREVTGLREVPDRLLVCGAGPVGTEMAQAVHRMGASVVIVEGKDHLLPREPKALGEGLGEALSTEGIELHFGLHASAAKRHGDGYALEFPDGTELHGDKLLVAAGRRPRTADLGLEEAGVSPGDHGEVPVDSRMRAGDGVWAIGDVTGIWPLTYVGKYQGRVAAENILGGSREAGVHRRARAGSGRDSDHGGCPTSRASLHSRRG